MERINDVSIQKAIIHVLDKNTDEPVLNEFPLSLTEDVYCFIYKHITRSLNDDNLKAGKFTDDKSIIETTYEEFCSKEISFIEMSKTIAIRLFNLMKTFDDIPSCDLLVVDFLTEYGPMVGIIKMDFNKFYSHSIEFVNDKVGIKLSDNNITLPQSSKKIQKAAFIGQRIDGKSLYFINKINKRVVDEYGSDYWIKNFLGCNKVKISRDYTKDFINNTERFIQKSFDDAESQEYVRSAINKTLLNDEKISTEILANEVFKRAPETKEIFLEYLNNSEIPKEFNIDKDYANKRLKKVKLKIDNDIEISVTDGAYKDSDRFEIIKNGDGSINMVIKNIINYIQK